MATAQVVRCTDPATGSVTYTDGACASGQTGTEVAPRQTPEEIRLEREQAERALQLKHERQAAEAQSRASQPPADQAPGATAQAAPDPALSQACLQARQTLQGLTTTLDPSLYDTPVRLDAAQQAVNAACLSPAEQARLQAYPSYPPAYDMPIYNRPVIVRPPRPRPPRPAPEMVQCNVFRCYDRQGNVYPR